MTTPAVDTDRVRGRTRMRVACLLGGCGLILAVLLTVVILWWVMPSWFRLAVIAYAPGVDLAYRAAEADGGGGGLEDGLRERFSAMVLLRKAVDRVEHGTAEQRQYGARCIGWVFWRRGRPSDFALDDPVLRQRLVDALVAVSRGPEQPCADAACAALLEMGEFHRLPEILRILDRQPKARWHSMLAFRRHTADPLVTTHLLKWFHATPDYTTLSCLMAQNDPRVEDLLISVVASPSYHSALRNKALYHGQYSLRPASPGYLAAVRGVLAEKDDTLRYRAMQILTATDEDLDWMLDVRLDPTAESAHRDAERYLMDNADDLSIEQSYRWISAPPLPANPRR